MMHQSVDATGERSLARVIYHRNPYKTSNQKKYTYIGVKCVGAEKSNNQSFWACIFL